MWKEVKKMGYSQNNKQVFLEINKKGEIRKTTQKKITITNENYQRVEVTIKGKRKRFCLHKLLAETFIKNDNPKEKTQVNHKDGNKHNNKLDNLEWATPSENTKHAIKNGLHIPYFSKYHLKGEKSFASKLKNKDIRYIRESSKKGVKLAKKFNVSSACISRIRNNKDWKHIN